MTTEITCPSCGEPISTDYLSTDPARRRYFAIVKESFENLPAHLEEKFPTAEHLRKWCLIRAGWCEIKDLVTTSKSQSHEIAALMRHLDRYAVISVNEQLVIVATAKSQTRKAQPKAQFMETAQKVYRISRKARRSSMPASASSSPPMSRR
jgi:hypothetical protein